MSAASFDLPSPDAGCRGLTAAWLKLAVLALLGSGFFSILLVLSRTPGVNELIPWVDFFHTALVVHVDLSVVIWFLAFAGVLWTLKSPVAAGWPDRTAWGLTAAGTLVIAVSPFAGAGRPLLNNYVPVLQHPLFYLGGALVLAGFLTLVWRSLIALARGSRKGGADAVRVGMLSSVVVALIALAALALSFVQIPRDLEAQAYFEFLFWGGGHVLQFTHTLLLLVAWLWLAEAGGSRIRLSQRSGALLFALAALPVAAAPAIYLLDPVMTAFHHEAFTELMRWGGLFAVPLGWVVVSAVLRRSRAETGPLGAIARSSLYASLVLFLAGGVIGFLIRGVNVVIPAHYHGSIVGVTLAFMGVAYLLLPRLGYADPLPRVARWQPYVYGGGQLMHIIGLAVSGGYGNIQRKTAGAAQGLEHLPEIIGMGLMGLGGLVSIIGGILFLVVMIRSLWMKPATA